MSEQRPDFSPISPHSPLPLAMISEQTRALMAKHATIANLKGRGRECCGLLFFDFFTGALRYKPCRNVAKNPWLFFEISADDWRYTEQALGDIIAVVHSHPLPDDPKTLSIADRSNQDLIGLDFVLLTQSAKKQGDWDLQIFPKINPLVGRSFVHGVQDCYSIFKDFYFLAGLDMAQFDRSDDWWSKGENLYLDNMAGQGFAPIATHSDVQLGDVILMQVGADVPNHAGIFVGNNQILHHSPHRLSKRDSYNGYWLKHTHSIWRHTQWQSLDFTVPLDNLARNTP